LLRPDGAGVRAFFDVRAENVGNRKVAERPSNDLAMHIRERIVQLEQRARPSSSACSSG